MTNSTTDAPRTEAGAPESGRAVAPHDRRPDGGGATSPSGSGGPVLRRADEPRSARIGASDVAAVLGLSPWRTPFGVWADKTLPAETPETPVQRRGHYLEAGLLHWLGDEAGAAEVVPGDAFDSPWYVHPDGRWPHVGCHPDGFLRFDGAPDEGAEIKTARAAHEWGDGPDEYPPHVWVQCQVQGALTGLRVRLGAYLPLSERFRVYVVEPAPEVAEMLDRAEAWWLRHIVGDEPPEIDGSDDARRWLLSRHPTHRTPLRPATDEEAALVRALAAAKAASKAADAEEKRLAALVQAAIGDAEGIELPSDAGRATWRATTSKTVDVKTMRAERPEITTDYERTTTTRRLLLSLKD